MVIDLKQLGADTTLRWRSNLWIIIDTPGGITDILNEQRTIIGINHNDGFSVLMYEDLDHAQKGLAEYEAFKQNEAHCVSFNVYTMPEDWNIALQRMDGSWLNIQQWDYLQRLHEQSK